MKTTITTKQALPRIAAQARHPLDDLDSLKCARLATLGDLFANFTNLPRVALSIRQPWSFFIVHGFKPVENRTWQTSYRGPVLIHAGGKPAPGISEHDSEVKEFISDCLGGRQYPALTEEHAPMGGIVGVAEIVDCVEEYDSPWFAGDYGFVLANARPLPFVPMLGKLGIFRLPNAAIRHGKDGIRQTRET